MFINEDPRDQTRIVNHRYNPQRHSFGKVLSQGNLPTAGAGIHHEDHMGVIMNLLTMGFSMAAMLLKIKWAGWFAVICSMIGYSSARSMEDSRQILSTALLGMSATGNIYK